MASNMLPLIAIGAVAMLLMKNKDGEGADWRDWNKGSSGGNGVRALKPGTHALKVGEEVKLEPSQAYGRMGNVLLNGKQGNYYGSGDFEVIGDEWHGKARATFWGFKPLKKGTFTIPVTSYPDSTSDAGAQESQFTLNVT